MAVKTEITVADLAGMAAAMEEKGMGFYTWAAGRFQNEEVVNVFKRLAEEEKEHAALFRRLLAMPEAGETVASGNRDYLQMLAGGEDIFPHHSDINAEKIKNPGDALAVGIQAEKDAILFYHELYNKASSSEVKREVSKILEEEKLHLMELRDYMNEL